MNDSLMSNYSMIRFKRRLNNNNNNNDNDNAAYTQSPSSNHHYQVFKFNQIIVYWWQ
ncbi:hypothetical protein DERF_006632 [Dermatophagoides farinae]|uniref:Uncharacterized protein n=1 Tax=Dermatophagoides farinae TaxID=6954 RepID=A0A922HZQ1_DERFA|nr:hypothetical protein DERF_006632 [Dermatophagoides farinae]